MDPTFFICQDKKAPPIDELVTWFSASDAELPYDPDTGELLLFSPRERTERKLPGYTGYMTESYIKNLPVYCDLQLWQTIQDTSERYSHVLSRYARILNPFEDLNRLSALTKGARAGIKLANIDAVFNITKSTRTFLEPVDTKPLKYFDLCGGPGSFERILQYIRPISQGTGISLKTDVVGCAWDKKNIDMDKFTIVEGKDGTGDIIKNRNWLINRYLSDFDLVLADGFIRGEEEAETEMAKKKMEESYRMEELINLNLIICECDIGMRLCKPGGNFLCKVADILRGTMAEVVFLLSMAFEKVCVFKPDSSRRASAEKYIVCLNRKPSIEKISLIFDTYYQMIDKGQTAQPLLGPLPPSFVEKFTAVNNRFLTYQKEEILKIRDFAEGKKVNQPVLNLAKAITAWHIPMTGEKLVRRAKSEC